MFVMDGGLLKFEDQETPGLIVMASAFKFKFTAPLSEITELLVHTVIYIPDSILRKLPQKRVRVKGSMNGVPFALAVQYRKAGNSFFMVSAPLRRAAKIKPGSQVNVEFSLVDPEKVDLPEEFEAVLAQDDDGLKEWNKLTPGRQRSLAHYVFSVKNVDSRIKRALFLIEKVKREANTKQAKKNT
jgi:hypothetical protein